MSDLVVHDVVIVGAGPVGLFLAIELGTAGVKPLVLERLVEPDRGIKAAAIGAVGAEALERRGFARALEEEQVMMPMAKAARAGSGPVKKPGGHFSALFVIEQELQRDPERHSRMVPQEALERILTARAGELGIEIRRGVAVEDLEQDEDGVTVRTSAGLLRATYLVGCDGGRSRVRKLAGFEFPGTDPTITGYQALVEFDAPEKLARGWRRTPRGLITSIPGRVFTAEFDGPPPDRDAPVTRAEVEASIRRVSGTDVRVLSMSKATRWSDNARQATTYRRGRVLLAGDAAHVHSPFGGQGLNLGLVDAANLGWKLAAAVKGRDHLLDSYTAERHPVGARVLENTRAQVALMRPDPLTSALRTIVSDLITLPEGNRHIGEMLSGVGIRYDLGDDDPLVGTLVKDQLLTLADGGEERLYARAEQGGGLFVSPSARSLPPNVHHVHTKEGPSMLVRPDGCVAWTEASAKPLDAALTRWF
ncbi:FAD-dependent monooxygenase [Saccharothrix variisporea]|uniref:2-polyprenyl-6-methoxyphenol hydroxylase-like FAD-dependent oxidoreductase n=1 Tax=Saccharothrix variisporea TaxID=543527 RepID=A0A495X5R7_9PSEU|nr:FAD-dependent monooxygenase [Saccharothrix variisporea]RKT69217.1 2-polyprenyl-6-methoxyphenol hydroxylase-like FAD-dependent oxidoreductase [Saccharothrix variisporea]